MQIKQKSQAVKKAEWIINALDIVAQKPDNHRNALKDDLWKKIIEIPVFFNEGHQSETDELNALFDMLAKQAGCRPITFIPEQTNIVSEKVENYDKDDINSQRPTGEMLVKFPDNDISAYLHQMRTALHELPSGQEFSPIPDNLINWHNIRPKMSFLFKNLIDQIDQTSVTKIDDNKQSVTIRTPYTTPEQLEALSLIFDNLKDFVKQYSGVGAVEWMPFTPEKAEMITEMEVSTRPSTLTIQTTDIAATKDCISKLIDNEKARNILNSGLGTFTEETQLLAAAFLADVSAKNFRAS